MILGCSEVTRYEAGVPSSMRFGVDGLDVSGIKSSRLATAGLLVCSLREAAGEVPAEGDREVADVNMVVQVEKRGAELIRTIFDPTE